MNKQLLKKVLEHALQTLTESFTYERTKDYGICGQIQHAYHKLCPDDFILKASDDLPFDLPFHLDQLQSTLIMCYLQHRYQIDKSIEVFWWPIAVNSHEIDEPWAEEGRQSRLAFLNQAISDLESEIKEGL